MWTLFQENCRYVFRSRMVYLILIFSSVIHYAGLKLLNHLTLSIQGVVSVIGPKEAVYTAVFIQLFTALSISSVYGIWIAPYAHRGERSVLTHVLPINKIKFPICYVICCSLLLLINFIVMVGSFASVFGFAAIGKQIFPWGLLLKAFIFETLCLDVVMLGLALSSLVFGQVATFFIGGTSLFVLQIVGAAARLFRESTPPSLFSGKGLLLLIYEKLPPMGDFIFDFKEVMIGGRLGLDHLVLWTLWLVILHLLFWFKVRYPSQARSTEA